MGEEKTEHVCLGYARVSSANTYIDCVICICDEFIQDSVTNTFCSYLSFGADWITTC